VVRVLALRGFEDAFADFFLEWIGVRLDTGLDWNIVASLIKEAYRVTAPKRLVKQMDATPPPAPPSASARGRGRPAPPASA